MQLENYTDVATDIILSSIKSAQDKKKPPIPIFLLVSMLEHADSPIPAMLISHKIDKNKILSEASAFIDTLHESHTEDTDEDSKVVSVDSSFVALLERANKSASDNGDSFVDTLTVFKQFYTEGIDNAPLNILRGVGLTVEKVVTSFKQIRGTKKVKSRKERSGFKTLEKYCTNMIKSANSNEFSPVIGREKEMRRIIQILCRKSKNNPIVIGESGVGKTAIVEGLAQKLSRNDVPDFLKGAELFELNMSALIGGAAHRGDLEKRVNELMDVVSDLEKNIILFIDEIHAIAKGGDGAISDLLKPALSRGKVRIIGATTLDEYRVFIEKDKALERRLQSVFVDPPTVRETVGILRGLRDTYEAFHGLHIRDASLVTACELSDRYVTFRNLPDKAIDLIDEAAARVRAENEMTPAEMSNLLQKILMLDIEIDSLRKESEVDAQEEMRDLEKDRANAQERYDTLQRKFNTEKGVIDRYRKAKAEKLRVEANMADAQAGGSDRDDYFRMKVEDLPRVEEALRNAQDAFQQLRQTGDLMVKEEISPLEIAQVISDWIGIPAQSLSKSDREKLATLQADIEEMVFGQPEAVKGVSDAIIRSRAGLSDESRPIGSFLFLGPSGVGKTWLAKCLAKLMFDDFEHMIRIDMSEYGEKHSVSRLVGAPPGYIGFEQGGQLTEAVRRRPYTIVLLDEIEKAHPEVFDVLLQVLDDGRLTDGQGRVVNFKNTIIIMTSNIGSHLLLDALTASGTVSQEVRDKVVDLLRAKYRPEILNRIDEIVVFDPLDSDLLSKIAVSCLQEVKDRLAKKKIELEWTEDLITHINSQEYDPSQGARGMKSYVKKYIETEIASAIVHNHDAKAFKIDVAESTVKIHPLEDN